MLFRFRLDPVLDQRERVERERAADHARALAERLDAVRAREQLGARRDAARRRLTREHETLAADGLRMSYAHLDYLDRSIAAAERRIADAAVALEEARLRHVDAAKDRKVLETLKARKRAVHAAEAARDEQRELDDQNARLAARLARRAAS